MMKWEKKTMTSNGLLAIKHEQRVIILKRWSEEKSNDFKWAVGYQAWTKGYNSESWCEEKKTTNDCKGAVCYQAWTKGNNSEKMKWTNSQ